MEEKLETLALMSRTLGVSLSNWLRMERDRAARLSRSWEESFMMLHRCFHLPFSIDTQEREEFSPLVISNPLISRHPHRQLFTHAQHRLFCITVAHDEARWLLSQFYEGGCLEWALLLATLLMEVDVIVEILSNPSGPETTEPAAAPSPPPAENAPPPHAEPAAPAKHGAEMPMRILFTNSSLPSPLWAPFHAMLCKVHGYRRLAVFLEHKFHQPAAST